MSKLKISAVDRQAIWLAHNRKCAYSGELVDLRSMHVDHIIPEWLQENPTEFEVIKQQLELPKNFQINGFENLLPCSPGYNLQKGEMVFDNPRVQFFLSIANSKKKEIEKNIERIKTQLDQGKAAILLQSLLETKKLNAEEVAKILEDHQSEPEEVFKLIESLKLFNSEEIREIRRTDIEQLRAKPIKLGGNDHIDGVELHKTEDDTVYVRTCEQYDEAIKNGYYGATTYAMKMQTFFEHQCGLLTALSSAGISEKSFISDPRVGITDLQLLPASLFPVMGEAETSNDDNTTYQDLVDAGTLQVKGIKSNLLLIENPGAMGQQLIEVARADFDGDGIEDILLFEYCYATEGTLGFGTTRLITRKSSSKLFEIVS